MKKILVCCLTAMVMFTSYTYAQTDVTGQLAGSSLEEALGTVVEEYGNTNYSISIFYSNELGVSDITVGDSRETVDNMGIMTITSGSQWHYAGHVKDTLSTVSLGKKLQKRLKSGQDYMLYLKATNDGGYDVYYKIV